MEAPPATPKQPLARGRAAFSRKRRPSAEPPGSDQLFLDDNHDRLIGDVFGHGDYARTLAAAIGGAPSGTTFGLFGEWGIGKSSVLWALRDELRTDGEGIAIVDAWRYEADAFRRDFLREVTEQLCEQGTLGRFDTGSELRDLDLDVATPRDFIALGWRRLLEFLVPVAVAAVTLVVLLRVMGKDRDFTWTVAALIAAAGWTTVRADKLVRVRSRTETRKRLEDADRFSRRFGEILGNVTVPRVVIAIDNLDRLDPASALEVLRTVKTYLEPAARGRRQRRLPWSAAATSALQVHFIIAVDEKALIAHLASKVSEPARADEFLRKFFSVRITMRSLLDDDLQSFVRSRLEPLVDRWTPDRRSAPFGQIEAWKTQQLNQLTDLVAAGLRANPRRLKQFVNSLQITLMLLAERHSSGNLSQPIHNLALVGQLVLIEEEFPETFAHLLVTEGLLEDLHLGAQGLAHPYSTVEWGKLAPVLRSCYRVDRSDARAILRLKVTNAERSLPDHDQILAAMRAGDFDEVDLLLDPANRFEDAIDRPLSERSEHARPWAVHLPELVRREVAAQRYDVAANLLRCAFEVDVLRHHQTSTKDAVCRAIVDPEMRAGLWRLPVEPLLAAISTLPPKDFRLALDALSHAYAMESGPAENDRRFAQALAEYASKMSNTAVDEIRTALATEPRMSHRTFAPLVLARPEIAPDQLCEALTRSLSERVPTRPPPGRYATQVDPAQAVKAAEARQATREAIEQWVGTDDYELLLRLAATGRIALDDAHAEVIDRMLEDASGSPDVVSRLLNYVRALATSTPSATENAIRALSKRVLRTRHGGSAILLSLDPLLRHPSPQARASSQAALNQMDGVRLIDLAAEAEPALGGPLRELVSQALNADRLDDAVGIEALRHSFNRKRLLAQLTADDATESVAAWFANADNAAAFAIDVADLLFTDRGASRVESVAVEGVTHLRPNDGPDGNRWLANVALQLRCTISEGAESVDPSQYAEASISAEVDITALLRPDRENPGEVTFAVTDVQFLR